MTLKKKLGLRFHSLDLDFQVAARQSQPKLDRGGVYQLADLMDMQGVLVNVKISRYNKYMNDVEASYSLPSDLGAAHRNGKEKIRLIGQYEKLSENDFNARKIEIDNNVMVYLTIKGIESQFIELMPNSLMYDKFYHEFYVINLWEANTKKPTFLFRHENVRIIDFKIKVASTLDIILIFLKQSLDSDIYTLNINYFKKTTLGGYSLEFDIKLSIVKSSYSALQILDNSQQPLTEKTSEFLNSSPLYIILYSPTSSISLVSLLLQDPDTQGIKIGQFSNLTPPNQIYRRFSAVLVTSTILYIASISTSDNIPAISLYDIKTQKNFYLKRLFEANLTNGHIKNIFCIKQDGSSPTDRGGPRPADGKIFLEQTFADFSYRRLGLGFYVASIFRKLGKFHLQNWANSVSKISGFAGFVWVWVWGVLLIIIIPLNGFDRANILVRK